MDATNAGASARRRSNTSLGRRLSRASCIAVGGAVCAAGLMSGTAFAVGNPNPASATTSPLSADGTATATVGPYLALTGGFVNYGTIVPTLGSSTYPATSSLSLSTSAPAGVNVTVTAGGAALGITGATQTVSLAAGGTGNPATAQTVIAATGPVNQAYTSSWLLTLAPGTVLTRGTTPSQVLTYTASGTL